MDHLEEEYKRLLASLFDKLRENVEYGETSHDVAEQLHTMLQERLGISDPNHNEPPWERSSSCHRK